MLRTCVALGGLALAVLSASVQPALAQNVRDFPLAPTSTSGNFVAPYFDGFYQNPDSTWTLSFGFLNRNNEALIEIPVGPNNYMEPAEFDGMQATTFPVVFYAGFGGPRERGVFAVVVPKDFLGDVWWHLTSPNGYTTRVPGRLISPGAVIQGAYELSTGPQAAGSMRPAVRFSPDGEMGLGPLGIVHPETFGTTVGQPITVTAWVEDRGERELGTVRVSLWKHQGPVGAEIRFAFLVPRAPREGGVGGDAAPPQAPTPVAVGQSVRIPPAGEEANQATFTATFDAPGEYVIRIRVDNFGGGDSSPGNMCCWSNGYVRIVVTE